MFILHGTVQLRHSETVRRAVTSSTGAGVVSTQTDGEAGGEVWTPPLPPLMWSVR